MQREIQKYLDAQPEQKLFVRLHPEWYRKLSRNPETIRNLKAAADQFYGKTFSQRLDQFNEQAGLFSMLMSMAQAMGNSKGKGEKTS